MCGSRDSPPSCVALSVSRRVSEARLTHIGECVTVLHADRDVGTGRTRSSHVAVVVGCLLDASSLRRAGYMMQLVQGPSKQNQLSHNQSRVSSLFRLRSFRSYTVRFHSFVSTGISFQYCIFLIFFSCLLFPLLLQLLAG